MHIHEATEADAPEVSRLVNEAYAVERFFVRGDRTSPADVLAGMRTGVVLVAARPGGGLAGCVHVEARGDPASFGMLAVAPSAQGQGLGHRLIAAAEARARDAACRVMEIRVVNLRTDLLPGYERLGYAAVGTEAYLHRPVLCPCHFIVMRKVL